MPNDSIPTHHRRASRASFTASSRDIGCQRVRRAAPATPMRPTEPESDSYNSSAGATSTLLAQFGGLPRRKRQTAEKNAPAHRRVPNPGPGPARAFTLNSDARPPARGRFPCGRYSGLTRR